MLTTQIGKHTYKGSQPSERLVVFQTAQLSRVEIPEF